MHTASNTATHSGTHVRPTSGSGVAALIRPAWTPVTIGITLALFLVGAWPFALAMMAYIIWGDRLDAFKADANRATDSLFQQFGQFGRGTPAGFGRSGNVAFDDWREAEMKRLDEERRKLAEMEREFVDYQRELRRAKDREEFDSFLRGRKTVDGSEA